MKKITGGQAVVQCLKNENVKYVFGLIGSATMEIFDALYDAKKIKFIGVRDERTGTHIADGYARASGETGIILAGQNGPGVTNLVTGLAQAKAAFTPVVSLAGAISSEHANKDAFQEVDQQALITPVTKKTWTVSNPEQIQATIQNAFRVANAPQKGPVHLNLPRDTLAQKINQTKLHKPEKYRPISSINAPRETIRQAAKIIKNAKRPVIIAGGGIKNQNHKTTISLAETVNAPIVCSPGHGDAIPFGHPLNAGQMGPRGNPVATKLTKNADVIIALGTRLGFNSTFFGYQYLNKNAKIIHVEQEQTAIAKYFPVTIGIWGDATNIAKQIQDEIKNNKIKSDVRKWADNAKKERQKWIAQRDKNADTESSPMQPLGLFKTLRKIAPKNTVITLDAGTLCLQATDALNYHHPKSLFSPLDFGLVGFSFAAGLGAKLAMPNRPVISLIGDGGFSMTTAELSTAVEHNINTITLVMNNGCWGAEKAYQKDFFSGRYIGADIKSPPFDKLAEIYGAKGYNVTNTSQVSEAIRDALKQNKPAVIDAKINPDALYSFRRDSFAHRKK